MVLHVRLTSRYPIPSDDSRPEGLCEEVIGQPAFNGGVSIAAMRTKSYSNLIVESSALDYCRMAVVVEIRLPLRDHTKCDLQKRHAANVDH